MSWLNKILPPQVQVTNAVHKPNVPEVYGKSVLTVMKFYTIPI